MCPSMADTDFYTTKTQKISSTDHANPSKYYNQFLFKAIIVTIFLVILPLLPSQAPEFINQNLHARSWELLQLIFVGIAVSYGLFSKRNDETDKEHYSKLDTAQSYVSRLLQVSSVFDDETESPSASDDNKVQTWNSQYYRGEPVVMVAKEKSILEKQNAATTRIDEKPLLLPVRSLKSRVSEPNEPEATPESSVKPGSISRSNSNLGSKRYASHSTKSRNGEGGGGGASQAKMEENIEENVVHRSPIPWRSRSGRFEMKEDEEVLSPYPQHPKMEDSELKRLESRSFRSQSFRSSKPNSAYPSPNKPASPTTPSSPKIQSPLPYFSSESQAKSVEDAVRKKVYYKSPPPPPPPPPQFLHKSLMKSKSCPSNERNYPQKEIRRSIRSVPNDYRDTEIEGLSSRANSGDVSLLGKPVRALRQGEPVMKPVTTKEFDENIIEKRRFTDKMMHMNSPSFKRQTFTEFPEEEKKEVIEKLMYETDDDDLMTESEDDYFEEGLESSGTEGLANDNAAAADEGPDVDKKADEFIAKFREQIRLQRIESFRKSAGQLARNRLR